MKIQLTTFKGMAPAIDAPALADNAAQSATNVDFSGGTLRPLLMPELVGTTQLDRSGTTSSMYRYLAGGSEYWLKWVGEDVSLCLSPLPTDPHERVFWTSSAGKPQYSYKEAIITGGGSYPNNSYDLGMPAPAGTISVAAAGTPTSDDPVLAETRSYVVTYVEAIDGVATFEGPPSSPSPVVTVLLGQSVNLSNLPGPPVGSNLVAYKNIYRTNTGTAGTEYQFVATISAAATTYSDTKDSADLGEVLPSATWTAPPADLRGLISLPSGALAGFYGNTVAFSVPYVPSAWPAEYEIAVEFPIVAIAAFGNGLVVLTKGNPYAINGTTPGSMGSEKLEMGTACMSAKGVMDFGDTIVYPSTRGLVSVGVQGVGNLTEGLVNQRIWASLQPETAVAARFDNFYIAWTNNTQIIFDIKTGDYSLHNIGWTPSCAWTDPVDGSLYLARAMSGNDALYRWGKGTAGELGWKSKRFRLTAPVSMVAARIVADSYSGTVTAKFYADGVLKHTQTVTSNRPFRLPSGFLAKEWEIEVTAATTIFDVAMATSITELAV